MFTLSCYNFKNYYYSANLNENYYIVTVKDNNDKECIKHDLTCCTESLANIPDRECSCVDVKKYSSKRATYLLTDEEAEELKKDSRVKSINLDRSYYDDVEDDCIELTIPPSFNDLKRSKNKSLPKRFKIINAGKSPTPPLEYYNRYNSDVYPLSSVMGLFMPLPYGTSPLSSIELNFYHPTFLNVNTNTGQLFRLQQKENPWIVKGLSSWEFIQHTNDVDTLKHKGAGEDVDLIIVDDGVWHGHVEFNQNVINAKNPRDYRNGNALRQVPQSNGDNGTCNILDIYLDAPALIDPDFFYDPEFVEERTIVRWDGTIIPQEIAALDWWVNNSLTARSSKYVSPENGGTATGDNDFGSFYNEGYEQFRDPDAIITHNGFADPRWPQGNLGRRVLCGSNFFNTPSVYGRHGTPCASLVYGRTMGWGYNCNKWSLYGHRNFEHTLDTITLFQKLKPITSNKKEKNPTIVSSSISTGEGLLYHSTVSFIPSGSETHTPSAYYTFRETTKAYKAVAPGEATPTSNLSSFEPYLRGCQYITPEWVDNSTTQAGDELIEAGVIWFQASKNGNTNHVNPGHPNFNNLIHPGSAAPVAPGPDYGYGNVRVHLTTSRRGFPEHMGKTEDYEYPVINVGALNNVLYQNKETKAPYSSNGNGIDLWAPAEATLAADKDIVVIGNSSQRVDDLLLTPNSIRSNNKFFNGTSAATPVAAGFISTLLSHHRDWGWRDLKKWINEELEGQQLFLNTGDPNTIDDINWIYKPESILETSSTHSSFWSLLWGSYSFTLPDGIAPKVPYLNWDIPST